MFLAILPITIGFALAGAPHFLNKLNEVGWIHITVPQFFLEPTWALWAAIAGIVIAGCVFMRQFVLAIFILFASFVVLIVIYVIYVI